MKALILSLLLIGLSLSPVAAQTPAEPNTPTSEIVFKVAGPRMDWTVSDIDQEQLFQNPDVNRPPYVAELWLHKHHQAHNHKRSVVENILKSPVSRELSKRQQAFLHTGYAVWVDYHVKQLPEKIRPKPDFFPIWLYAFSESDARTMVSAYLDQLNRQVAQRIASYKQRLADLPQQVQEAQEELAQKQKERDASNRKLEQLKKKRHEFDNNPEQSAKETIKEMRNVLDKLEIELAGIREKLKSIEAFRNDVGNQPLSPQVQIKLNEMYIELMIELSGLEARKALTERIQVLEADFLDLHFRVDNLNREARGLDKTIQDGKNRIATITRELENPSQRIRQPKVHKNTVRIHRVNGSSAPEDAHAYIEKVQVWLDRDYHDPGRIRDNLSETQDFLSKINSEYLQVEAPVVDRLRAILYEVRVLDVEGFLLRTQNVKESYVGALRQRYPTATRYFDGGTEYSARKHLELVEQGQLQLDPSVIKRLQYIANDLVREVMESGLNQVEAMTDEIHNRSTRRQMLENLKLLKERIEQDGQQLDPALIQRIDDCLKQNEEQ